MTLLAQLAVATNEAVAAYDADTAFEILPDIYEAVTA
jgi:hypothetical protein